MKNKSTLLKLLSFLFVIPCFIIPFVKIFIGQVITNNSISNVGEFGVFADYSDFNTLNFKTRGANISTIWMVLVSVLIIIVAILALAYITTLLMELFKVKCKSIEKNQKALSMLILVCSILAFVLSIITICVNKVTGTLGSTAKLSFAIGPWLLLFPIVAGIIGSITPKVKTKKSKKK